MTALEKGEKLRRRKKFNGKAVSFGELKGVTDTSDVEIHKVL